MSTKEKSFTVTYDGAALLPKLRFPEFQRTAGWPSDHLREFASIAKGEQLPASEKDKDAVYPHFNGGMSPSSYTQKSNREANTVIISEGGNSCGYVQFVDVPFWCGGHCYSLTPSSGVITGCLFYSLQSKQSQIMALRVGSGLPNIQKSTLEKFPLALPPTVDEQQKIADCLDSADALIAAQGRKVEALKAHKKGLMQQLFPQEGETQPRLRFPEFEGTGEWSQTELGRLIEIKGRIGYRGYTVADIVGPGEGAIALSPSNISEEGSIGFEKATFISWMKYNESPEIMVEKGQTLLVKTGSTYGKSAFVRDLPQECTVNPQIVVLKPISVNPFFLSILISGEDVQSKIEANVVGGAIPTLSQASISKFKVLVPQKYEQQRIANCLTSLDDLIAAEARKLDTLKTHKKGLMQQLFPQVGED